MSFGKSVTRNFDSQPKRMLNPLGHGRISRPITHGGGGRTPPPPITHIENGIKRFLYKHIAYRYIFFDKIFSFEGARPEKGLKI